MRSRWNELKKTRLGKEPRELVGASLHVLPNQRLKFRPKANFHTKIQRWSRAS